MADNTKIEWTEATWNIITGCSHASPGRKRCYAQLLAGTRLRTHPSRAGLTMPSKNGPVFNGEVRFNEEWLTQPLHWKRPRMIFVCAHGDLFHESVPDAWIDRVFAVMALAPQHTFQVLTKRSARMREYLCTRGGDWMLKWPDANPPGLLPISRHEQRNAMRGDGWPYSKLRTTFPLPNVWLGVSVEDQKRADERIPDLLATPAAMRWISAEPLLGPVDVSPYLYIYTHADSAMLEEVPAEKMPELPWRDPATTPAQEIDTPRIDWVVVGGESGPGARPMHPDWARSLRDQCAAAGVPFFFKQWGEFYPEDQPLSVPGEDHDPDKVDTSTGELMFRVGKKNAGRLLDGEEHSAMPEVPHGR